MRGPRRLVLALLGPAVLAGTIVPSAVAAPSPTRLEAPVTAASGSVTGQLPADRWTKVLWGWGKYSVSYSAWVTTAGGRYRCYTAPLPWPASSGNLPAVITHNVVGYGDCWLYSPTPATYVLTPVFPYPPGS